MAPSLCDFKVLSFDCYGTLIDWETGFFDNLRSLLERAPDSPLGNKAAAVERIDVYQKSVQHSGTYISYTEVLAQAYTRFAEDLGVSVTAEEALSFGKAVGTWPAFSDTVEGLRILKKYYKLIILSNVDHSNVENTVRGPLNGVEFDAVVTAADVGYYKPNHHTFQYLFNILHTEFQLDERQDLLHTAKSLPVDHVPAKELGLTSAWIARGDDGLSAIGGDLRRLQDKVAFTWRFSSIGEMAEAVEEAFRVAGGQRT